MIYSLWSNSVTDPHITFQSFLLPSSTLKDLWILFIIFNYSEGTSNPFCYLQFFQNEIYWQLSEVEFSSNNSNNPLSLKINFLAFFSIFFRILLQKTFLFLPPALAFLLAPSHLVLSATWVAYLSVRPHQSPTSCRRSTCMDALPPFVALISAFHAFWGHQLSASAALFACSFCLLLIRYWPMSVRVCLAQGSSGREILIMPADYLRSALWHAARTVACSHEFESVIPFRKCVLYFLALGW